jgi:DNA repair photolyase
MPTVKEVMCKSILSESKISELSLNPYSGCSNGCKYCYVRYMKRRIEDAPISAGVVEAKMNAPTVLLRQIRRMKEPRKVMMSSVCDAWQQAEETYGISRKCLDILLQFDFPISILTKRSTVMRDFDLLEKAKEVSIGVSLTTFDEKAASLIEPGASPPKERAQILIEAGKRGLRTFLFFGPLLPVFSDNEENIEKMLRLAKESGVRSVCVEKINYGPTVWKHIRACLAEHYPGLIGAYRRTLLDRNEMRKFLLGAKRKMYPMVRRSGLRRRVHFLF